MPFSLLRSIVGACVSVAHPPRRRAGTAGRRHSDSSMGLESLEQRMALTVSAPSIQLAAASDTGIRGDGITKLVRPVFAGWAPARSRVVVYADGQQLLGVATANAYGAWSVATPATQPLKAGDHTITAQAAAQAGKVWSTVTKLAMTVDLTPPKPTLVYDSVNGCATLTFSKPVSGVRLSNLMLSGRTQSGFTIPNVPINDIRARPYVGMITLSQSLDGRTFTFQEQRTLAEPGTYTLSFVRTGVVDRAGNLPDAGAATSFTIN